MSLGVLGQGNCSAGKGESKASLSLLEAVAALQCFSAYTPPTSQKNSWGGGSRKTVLKCESEQMENRQGKNNAKVSVNSSHNYHDTDKNPKACWNLENAICSMEE